MSKILIIVTIFSFTISACKNEPSNNQISSPASLTPSSPEKVEKTVEIIYLVGRFDGQVKACTTCDGYQKPHTWITRITEFTSLDNLEKEKQMDKWEDKLRQIFPGVNIISRKAFSDINYFDISQKRRELLSAEDASSTDALVAF